MMIGRCSTIFLFLWMFGGFLSAGEAKESPQQKPPNILLIILDDWGCDAGCYGSKWVNTPSIDRLAADSLVYDRAFTPNAKCSPSRAVLLTGRQSWLLGPACNHMPYFPVDVPTFTERLSKLGYTTGATGKVWSPGVALDSSGKPRNFCGTTWNSLKETPPTKDISSNDYSGNFESFLRKGTVPDKPWFFWSGPAEPHRAYEQGSGTTKGKKKLSDIDRVPAFWPDNETIRGDMLDYAFEVEHVDRHIGAMLDLLKERDEYDETLILLTSDHGPPFPRMKGDNYWYSHRIPLLVHYPRSFPVQLPSGDRTTQSGISKNRIQSPVDLSDLAPTILTVATGTSSQSDPNESFEGMLPMTGKVLPRMDSAESVARVVAIGRERHDAGRPDDVGYPVRGLIDQDYLIVHNYEIERWPACNPETGYLNCDGSPTKSWILNERRRLGKSSRWDASFGKRSAWELYHLASDPDCMVNLVARTDHQERLQLLQSKLEAHLKREGDPRSAGLGEIFDRYEISNDESRGFYDRYLKGLKPRAGWVHEDDFESAPLGP